MVIKRGFIGNTPKPSRCKRTKPIFREPNSPVNGGLVYNHPLHTAAAVKEAFSENRGFRTCHVCHRKNNMRLKVGTCESCKKHTCAICIRQCHKCESNVCSMCSKQER